MVRRLPWAGAIVLGVLVGVGLQTPELWVGTLASLVALLVDGE